MILLSQLLKTAQAAFSREVTFRYSHPNLYLICTSEQFRDLTQEERVEKFSASLALECAEIEETVAASTLQLVLVTREERERDFAFLNDAKTGHHWIEYFTPPLSETSRRGPTISSPRSIHFYGFKGGQGRSTILALLAKQMADDGFRVLAVDADLEAPSLDILLNATATAPSSTLLGYGTKLDHFRPLPAYLPRQGPGVVDVIPCRPSGEAYNLDFAAFVLRSSLDVLLPEEIAAKIRDDAERQNYDLVLFDHRSGLSTSILPVMSACPGPVVICLRLDDQSSTATGFFEILFRQNVDYPGLFVSFSLDPEDTLEKMHSRHALEIDGLLAHLSDALALGASPIQVADQFELPLTPDDLSDYWIPWFHDRALLNRRLPDPTDLSKDNLASLQQIRTLIGFAAKKEIHSRVSQQVVPLVLSSSGATDEGPFIETIALRKLVQANTPHTYIFGRKGTGKTRLVRELAIRHQGEPLVVASDFQSEGGIPSSHPSFKDLSDSLAPDPEKFWWAILASALDLPAFPARQHLMDSVKKRLVDAKSRGVESVQVTEIVEMAARQKPRRVFLVDGIETAFLSSSLLAFLEGLFKFLLSIQNNPSLQEKVTVRLFLRTDLARRAFQNIEQQISGRVINLSWDTQSILNFVLSRIKVLPWFRQTFPSTVLEIGANEQLLVSGSLPITECDRLLTQIFPQKIRRNNLLMLTFLKTYFSDSAGEAATYYPRIYDRFLQLIDNPTDLGRQLSSVQRTEEGRVSQALIFGAHEQAAKDYLQQVEAELFYLLQLAPNQPDNVNRVKELLQAFVGFSTPFRLESRVQELSSKLQGVPEPDIRTALAQMREVGIFEERPGSPGEWRVGRLFKASLGMKYVR
jgi:Mrp family chromosome partitioning ATPase